MSDDGNIIDFPSTVNLDQEGEAVVEVLECDHCANKTWQVSPDGTLRCPICKTDFDFRAYLFEG